jgi:AraC family transcriptional regulator, transcriptional activator FtrA
MTMSFARHISHAAAFLSLPGLALLFGLRTLEQRDHPSLLPPFDSTKAAFASRPVIDRSKATVVVLLGADLTEITDALGPYEMFARAGKYNVITAAPQRQPTRLTGGLRILPHYSLAEVDSILGEAERIVVIPNLPNATALINRPVIDWLRQQAAAGALLHSWCKGAMALAETGLLDGRTATAHWGDLAELEKRYPRVTWLRGVRWVDHGQYVMSAGITSGIDASLRVLRRTAGDSVARRVAAEIRYPNYHFAIDPTVEQYQLRPADLVLLANASFRFNRPRAGVALYDGIGELDLSNVYDAHVHLRTVDVETIALHQNAIKTLHGLTVFASATPDRLGHLNRLIVQGTNARIGADALVRAITRAAPQLRPEYLHADQPTRFGLELAIEDLARTADVATARFALKRMEYRSADIRFDGPALPWGALGSAVLLGVLGTAGALAFGRVRNRSKVVARSAHASHLPRLRWHQRNQQGERTMSRFNQLIIALMLGASAWSACADSPTAPDAPAPRPPAPVPPASRVVASVTLDAAQLTIDEGATRQLRATARDAQGVAIDSLIVSWTSSDHNVANIGSSGVVTGVRAGNATVTATIQGKSAQAVVQVRSEYAYDLLYTARTVDIFHETFRIALGDPGAAPTRLFPQQQWSWQPQPSPDGARIAYVCPNPIIGDASICVANADGSAARMIVAFISDVFQDPVWSPDGKRLAYVRWTNDGTAERSHIWTVNADGSNPLPLTTSLPGNQNMPAWSPRLADGSERIAFVQDVNTQPRIWSVRVDGTGLRQLGTRSDAYDLQPAWSPDGRTIAFQRTTPSSAADIWLMDADGSGERPLMPFVTLARTQLSPVWSPDGRFIAFASNHESAVFQLYTVWSDGSKLARRTHDQNDKATPAWIRR